MTSEETESQKKQTELHNVNVEYTNHVQQAGQKAWLIRQYPKEIDAHHAKMDELNERAAKLKREIADLQPKEEPNA